jgi:hypothetical protein
MMEGGSDVVALVAVLDPAGVVVTKGLGLAGV